MSETRAGSLPKVPEVRAQRGSVARSAMGCSARRIPTARYSSRTVSAKARTRSTSPVAPSPIGSGHREKLASRSPEAGLSVAPWRGSEESVTGIPSRVSAASRCISFCHCAAFLGGARSKRTWRWLINRDPISSGAVSRPGPSVRRAMLPFRFIRVHGWNIKPTFSSMVILRRRSRDAGVNGETAVLIGVQLAVAVEIAIRGALCHALIPCASWREVPPR